MKENREIKFRAWDTVTCAMHTDKDSRGMWQVPVAHNGVIESTDEIKLMQYTGLKDRKGKEIYEGDILKTDTTSDKVGSVKYEQQAGQFWIKTKRFYVPVCDGGQYGDEDGILCTAHEVIGNIYEDPELIK